MKFINMQYGDGSTSISIPEENLLGVLRGKEENGNSSTEEIVLKALKNPVGSAKLKDKVKSQDKICIVISDITRSWQRIDLYLPYIIKELNDAGVQDGNITILCANGSHRKQSEEEHKFLIGNELYKRFKVMDHDCFDKTNMVYLGSTSFGTPVHINKVAVESDVLIITGAVVFHDMAGFGGGRKSILPGISSYSTIMANHSLSLSPVQGEGSNKLTRSGKLVGNPMHEDMVEAAFMAKPDFMFNVIINEKGGISYAVAGDFVEAHKKACSLVERFQTAYIKQKADIVVASAGGYPKDINFYQGSKTLTNAREAVKEGGTIIIICECREGFGSDEMKYIIESFKDNLEREDELRKSYTIAKYTGFLVTETAARYKIMLVSNLMSDGLVKSGINIFYTAQEAIDIAFKNDKKASVYVMPHGANTFPVLLSEQE